MHNVKQSDRCKFIFITGGVVSSLGKGVAAASIARCLINRGLRVSLLKLDPYINVDPGTMNPFQHGEVFVTSDGAETDLDLGHYERFTNCSMRSINSVTMGQIYNEVIIKERHGKYSGTTVQVIPHITNEIKERFYKVANGNDCIIVEVGGTVGDMESLPFLETIRQLKFDIHPEDVLYVHMTLLLYLKSSSEFKTKPTQHSVKVLREIGIQPDILLCRSECEIDQDIKEKIALNCSIPKDCIIVARDVDTVYSIPSKFSEQNLDDILIKKLNLDAKEKNISLWNSWNHGVSILRKKSKELHIALAGKYTDLLDSYKSFVEACLHASIELDRRVILNYISMDKPDYLKQLKGNSGILIPGGFGYRGVEEKMNVISYAREYGIPFFGVCLGMHCALIEIIRNVHGMKDVHSLEFISDTPNPLIIPIKNNVVGMHDGKSSMRLGDFDIQLLNGSKIYRIYGSRNIKERHRHRYGLNEKFTNILKLSDIVISGKSVDSNISEVIEYTDHPWFIGVQYHPEFNSRFLHPHPLFVDFLKAAIAYEN